MSSTIVITEECWCVIKNQVLLSKNDFDFELYKLIFPESVKVPDFRNINFKFPSCLTKAERWKIHTYSEKNTIVSSSVGDDTERQLTTFVDKEHIKYIWKVFNIVDEPIVRKSFEDFKRAILNDIMGIVDTHLNEEYARYYL